MTADSKSAWKTVCWKCFSFFKIPSGSVSKSTLKILKKGKFNNFTKKLKGKVYFAIFDSTFDQLLIGISKKGKHFQLSVFSADSKSADRIEIWVFWNFGYPIVVNRNVTWQVFEIYRWKTVFSPRWYELNIYCWTGVYMFFSNIYAWTCKGIPEHTWDDQETLKKAMKIE